MTENKNLKNEEARRVKDVADKPSEETREAAEPSKDSKQPSELDTMKSKLAELEKSVEVYKDQFLRKAADFENYKKRTENDFLNVTRYANEEMISELLPVLDDLERSLKAGKQRREFGSFFKGVELIYAKLMKVLEAQGLKPIEALGQEFNVEYHEALMQMPKDNVRPHTVIDEVEKGYLLHDKVIRHAKVIVAGDSQERARNVSEDEDETKSGDESTGKENP